MYLRRLLHLIDAQTIYLDERYGAYRILDYRVIGYEIEQVENSVDIVDA